MDAMYADEIVEHKKQLEQAQLMIAYAKMRPDAPTKLFWELLAKLANEESAKGPTHAD